MSNELLTYSLSEPLSGATNAKVDINAGDGNLTIDALAGGDQQLASGTLQYTEEQGLPARNLDLRDGQASLRLQGSRAGRPWFHLPWQACNGATEWQIHINPTVPTDITAHTDGGNVKLDLAGAAVTSVSADSGGGNVEVILPDKAADLSVTAKTGAGNVVVSIPSGVAGRIHASTGLGKAIIDPAFSKIDSSTYQSSDFDSAANKVEITVGSGAGNVIVNTQ